MKEFHGYELKLYNDKVEIYKNKKLIGAADDEEQAKSYIINELEES